jgi:putative flippase GtrA
MFKQEFILKVIRFGVVGSTVTGAFMGLNWLFAPSLGPDLGYLVAYPLAVVLHFCLNKWWTFNDGSPVKKKQVGEYLLLTLVIFLIQTGIFKLLLHFTAMPSWLASGLATVAQMVLAFVVMQRRVFASGPGETTKEYRS